MCNSSLSNIRNLRHTFEVRKTSGVGVKGNSLSSLAGFDAIAKTLLFPSGDDKTVTLGGNDELSPGGTGGMEESGSINC